MKKAVYFIMLGVFIYLGFLYEWKMGASLAAGGIYFFLFCVISVYYFSRKLNVYLDMGKILIEQKEECSVKVRLHNLSGMPVTVKVVLVYRYLSEKKEHRSVAKTYLKGKEQKQIACCFVPEHCGKIEIMAKKVYCYDFAGIFSKSKKCKEKIVTTVMPKLYPVNLVVSSRTRWFPVDGESYARDRSGDDTAEIYDVREYQAGDRMQKVHWKLSEREDALYIKEFSYPLGAAVILLLEENSQQKDVKSEFTEAVISIAAALLEAKCPHYIVWKKKEADKICRMLIRSEENLYEFIITILEFESGCLETDMEEHYRYEYKNDTYSTLMKIDTKLMLQINQSETLNMEKDGLEHFFDKTEIVV